jgi:hypothetical protein
MCRYSLSVDYSAIDTVAVLGFSCIMQPLCRLEYDVQMVRVEGIKKLHGNGLITE